jgi:molybdenum cofactor guanylyltransferase
MMARLSAAPVDAEVTGVVLAGGLGRRMSQDGCGVNKAMIAFRGRPLIEHVIDRIRPQVGSLIINGDPDEPCWSSFPQSVIPDRIPDRPGPLAGIHAALLAIRTPWLLCVPCDTPLLPPDLVSRLSQAQAHANADRVSVRCAAQAHPVIALLHRSLAGELEQYLTAGGRRIETWLSQGRWVEAPFDDEEAFVNLNTAHELRRLESTP